MIIFFAPAILGTLAIMGIALNEINPFARRG